jgi:hypothetical protein
MDSSLTPNEAQAPLKRTARSNVLGGRLSQEPTIVPATSCANSCRASDSVICFRKVRGKAAGEDIAAPALF